MSMKRIASLDETRDRKLSAEELQEWGWRYVDEERIERGAFDSSTMQVWWAKSELPAELRIRYGGSGSFVPLYELQAVVEQNPHSATLFPDDGGECMRNLAIARKTITSAAFPAESSPNSAK